MQGDRGMKVTAKDLTIEEKVALVKGVSFFRTAGVESRGVKGLLCLDGGTGLNFEQLFGDFCSTSDEMEKYFGSKTLQTVIANYYTPDKLQDEELELHQWITEKLELQCTQNVFSPGCFPPGILLGATWNPETVHHVAVALGREAAAYGIDLLLGTPYVNLMRDPLSGRLFEGYGEDPYLMTVLAPEVVKGVQEQGVAANVKHFAANNQETFRVGLNEIISKRALHELYFPAFKACVKAGVATVMSAYNQINGVPCTENHWLLYDLLRDAWGFDGTVLSDWGAVRHLEAAVAAGNDIAMPGPMSGDAMFHAIENGTLSEEELNTAVDHVLSLIETCKQLKEHAGAEEQEEWKESGEQKVLKGQKALEQQFIIEESNKAAYDAVVEGAVLLKNENNIFPIKGDVALFGVGAKAFYDCGTGSAGITTDRTSSLYEELKKKKGADHVTYEEVTAQTETLLVVGRRLGMEGNDRPNLYLPEEEQKKILEVIALGKKLGKKVGVILNVCGPMDCSAFEREVDGILCVFLPGMQGGAATAALLTGEENPSGKLTVTFPKRYEDTPTYINFPGDGYQTIYGEDIFVGYRYYDTKKIEVLYPFGHGLSYTTFVYGNPEVEARSFSKQITISVDVTNAGERYGKEVVMLFVHDVRSTLRKPQKELKAFEKIGLEPGETKKVTFTVTKEMLASYDTDLERWEAEEGYYDLMIAKSAVDIVGRERVYGEWTSAYSYSLDTPIKVLYEEEKTHEIIFAVFQKYGLDVGSLEDTYQYNSHTPIRSVINTAVQRWGGKPVETESAVLEEITSELAKVQKI